jgi:spore coat polysaccharide biosynthesis protein SpsF (cytidylyltransferase family)
MLKRVLERLRRARSLDVIGVATTTDVSDDPIVALCAAEDVPCHRGPVDDVLHRYVEAAGAWRTDIVVRVTGDCPFVCPDAIDSLVAALMRGDADYAGYSGPRLGEGVDPVSRPFLQRFDAMRLPTDEREHLALLVRRHRKDIRCEWIDPEPGLVPPEGVRLSVDEPRDLEFAQRVQRALPSNFTSYDLIGLLHQQPELIEINRAVVRTVPHGVR